MDTKQVTDQNSLGRADKWTSVSPCCGVARRGGQLRAVGAPKVSGAS